MNSSYLIAGLTAVAGFGAGWALKPAPASTTEPTVVDAPTKQSANKKPVQTSSSSSPSTPSTAPSPTERNRDAGDSTANLSDEERAAARAEQRREWQARMAEHMQERQKNRFDRQLEDLTQKLGLTPEQAEKLSALYAAKLQAYTDLSAKGMEGMRDPETVKQLAAILGDGDVNETLASVLSPEQQKEYTEMKTRERNNQIESITMRTMATLQTELDLTGQQKDAVYARLYEQASQKVNNPSPYDTLANSMGGGRWFSGQQLEDRLSVESGDQEVDRETRMAKLKELQDARNEEQVKSLQDVLNEQQLEAYREHLQSEQNHGRRGGRRGRR